MPEPSPLELAIAQLEAQRAALGDAAVDAAVQALRSQARPAPAVTGAPRLRQVSVLFVDVADSTAMLERVGAEDALALVSRALEGFARIVRAHGGQVLRFTGDGLKAAFGAERAREDDAAQAVRAGLRIVEAAAEHGARVARPLGVERFGVRVGIHSGPVLLGAGVDADRSAIGHAVHLAARMEQSAPVGRLRISRETWRQVHELFRCEAQPPLAVKGHEAPLVTFLVLDEEGGSEHTVRRGIEGLAVPMVAREAELTGLLALLERAALAHHVALAVVSGEAGMGKTRLRRELLRRLAQSASAPNVLRVRAHPSGGLHAYGLLRQLLARWLGIADDLAPARSRERLVAGLAPWLAREAQPRAERVGQLVGLDFGDNPAVQALGARQLREQAFEALREALHAAAAQAPLLLVLEDLHWADEASLDFVLELAQPAPVPLMLLLLARPAWLPPPVPGAAAAVEPPANAGAGLLERLDITLAPLEDEAAGHLAQLLLRPMAGAPEALRRLLVQRAGGNPYFMEELVRMLIDDGVIDARTRPWRLVGSDLGLLRVPETLVGVLQARLDALPPAELAALQRASIIGAVFWPSALAQLDGEAPQVLPSLVQRGLLVHRPTSAFDQAEEYAFQHHLLHEVAYGTVLKTERREGHARVARWLAARVAGRESEFLAIAAEHYERAGEHTQAFEYYNRARRHAESRFAHEAVLKLIERALALPAPLPPRRRFALLWARQGAYDRMERKEDAERAVREMHECAEANDDDTLRAEVAIANMLRADHEGRADDARRFAELAITLGERGGAAAAAVALTLAHGELAWLAVARRDFAAADRHLAEGFVHARRAALLPLDDGGYDGYEVQLRCIEIRALLTQERYTEVTRAACLGLASLARMTRPMAHDRFVLLESLHEAHLNLGELDEARASAQQALERSLEIGMPRMQVAALVHLSDTQRLRGDLAAAQDSAEQALRLANTSGVDYGRPPVHECRGRVALALGDLAGAAAQWREAIERYVAQGREREARDMRAELAALQLQLQPASLPQARRDVDEVLAQAAAEGPAPYRALMPQALLACLEVLEAGGGAPGDARAGHLREHLRRRLAEQLAQRPDGEARRRLVHDVPHWAMVQRRLDAAADTSAGRDC